MASGSDREGDVSEQLADELRDARQYILHQDAQLREAGVQFVRLQNHFVT